MEIKDENRLTDIACTAKHMYMQYSRHVAEA